MKRILVFIFLVFLCTPLFSQTVFTLDSVLVTASKLEGLASESGKSVRVIGPEELAALPVSSVDELLRFVTGVNLNARNGFGVQSDFGMRGSTFSQVLVLIDNIRFNNPLTAHLNQNIPLSVGEIAQIEVIAGPAAASFGPDAVGGLIHIKTKTYVLTQKKRESEALRTQGVVGLGQHNLLESDVSVGLEQKNWAFSGGVRHCIAEGEQLENPNFGVVKGTDSLFNNYFDLRSYTASAAHFPGKGWKVYTRLGYDHRRFSAKHFYTQSPYDEAKEKTSGYYSQLSVRKIGGRHRSELNLSYKKDNDRFAFNPKFAPNVHSLHTFVGNFDQALTLGNNGRRHKLSYGTQFISRHIESTDRGNHRKNTAGIYSVFSYLWTPHLRSIASLRLEYDPAYGLNLLPQLSLSYFRKQYVLRASAGRTIRAPDFTEQFISFNIPNLTPGRNIGNPDLKAETSVSVEVGADYIPSQYAEFGGTIFYRHANDLIDYVSTNANQIKNISTLRPNENYFYAQNIARANTFGFELKGEQRFPVGKNNAQIILRGGYTYLNTRQMSEKPSRYIANHPKHNANLSLRYRCRWLKLALAANYIERKPLKNEKIGAEVKKNYLVFNLKLSLMPITDVLSCYLKVQNLSDTAYQEILGAKMPGRWIMGGIAWRIGKQ